MQTRIVAAVWAALGMTGANAAGFALIEQNASGLGNAYAGQAATAQDASTIFFNPAGLTEIDGRQVTAALHYISPSAKFTGVATTVIPGYTPPTALGGDAGEPAWVPNAYFTMDLRPGLKFGLGLNAPFGLATEYDASWAGQIQAIKSEVKTININPTLAWQIDDRLSLGFGLDWQRIDAKLSNFARAAGVATVKGDDNAWGYNLGLLFKLDDASRIGLSYRSRVKYNLDGTVSFSNTLVPSDLVKAAITLPSSASLGYFRKLNDHWDLLADLTWTGWGVFNTLAVYRASGVPLTTVNEGWDDVLRVGLGATYHQNQDWSWRVGMAYDQAPVPDAAHRTPRIPDEDRVWLAVGGQRQLPNRSKLDFGYAHLFVKNADIAHTNSGVTVTGSYDNAVDILSVQYTYNF